MEQTAGKEKAGPQSATRTESLPRKEREARGREKVSVALCTARNLRVLLKRQVCTMDKRNAHITVVLGNTFNILLLLPIS